MTLDAHYNVDPEWEWYIGELFHKLISAHNKNFHSVVEFAPGYKYKIGYALSKIGFSGTLYVIDAHENVLRYVEEKYRTLLPNATIIPVHKDLTDSITCLPPNIDLFLSNHSIDDMIISAYMDEKSAKMAFDNNVDSKELLLTAWKKLRADLDMMNDAKNKAYNDLIHFFDMINVDLIIMSQYKSNEYFLHNLHEADDITRDVFLALKKAIPTDDVFINALLSYYVKDDDDRFKDITVLNNTQNAANWIVGHYKSKGSL